jgi:hypothetical protein
MKIFNYLTKFIKAFVIVRFVRFLANWLKDSDTLISIFTDARTTFAAGFIIGGTSIFDLTVSKILVLMICVLGWIVSSMVIYFLKNLYKE